MTSETLTLGASTYALSYTHTPNGHVASLTYPDSAAVAYAPNALGEATQVGTYATAVTRHPNGALKNLTYGNGIAHTTEQNLRGLPSRSTDTGILDDGYSYDENGNVTAITDHFAGTFTRTMTYDDRDRLTAATNTPIWGGTQSFIYDPLDNLREMATPKNGAWVYRYNGATRRLDQIDRPSDGLVILSYGYDARGRATSRSSTGAAQTFAVDLADRVTGIGPSVATYRYDGHGRRTSVTKAGAATVQVYSQAGQLLYQSSDGIFRSGFQNGDTPYTPSAGGRRYVYLGRHLIAEDGTTGRQYIHTDGLGSPGRKTTVAGTPSGREDYKPYGYVFSPAQSSPGFAGHVTDAETGLSYMQARYYDPYAGRFLAVDPVGASPGSFNRYWYANNSPYKNVDPDGRAAAAIVPAAVAGAVACARVPVCRVAAVRVVKIIAETVAGTPESEATPADTNEPTAETDAGPSSSEVKPGDAFPDRELPRTPGMEPAADPDAEGPYTQLGRKEGSKGSYPQAREFDSKGKPVRDIDFTDHGRPKQHPNPHQHRYQENPTGGTPRRGDPEPLPKPEVK